MAEILPLKSTPETDISGDAVNFTNGHSCKYTGLMRLLQSLAVNARHNCNKTRCDAPISWVHNKYYLELMSIIEGEKSC